MPPPSLDLVFSALSDPTRRAILAQLALGEASVTTLVESFSISQPAVSKHLKVLEHAGLVSRGRTASFRPCRLRAQPLQEAAQWIGGYRQFWEQSFDRLEAYARELRARQPVTKKKKTPQRESANHASSRKPRKRRKP